MCMGLIYVFNNRTCSLAYSVSSHHYRQDGVINLNSFCLPTAYYPTVCIRYMLLIHSLHTKSFLKTFIFLFKKFHFTSQPLFPHPLLLPLFFLLLPTPHSLLREDKAVSSITYKVDNRCHC